MQKPNWKSLLLPLFMAASYAWYIWLRLEHILRIRQPREFYDTTEFLEISSRSLTSSAFWVTTRPPVTPLFFRLLAGDFERIMMTQFWISVVSWGILAWALTWAIRTYWLKPAAFAGILAFSLVQNIILWDSLILGDSLSMSLLALFLAASLWLLQKWTPWRFATLVIIATLLAFIRDTYAFFLLMVGGVVLIFLFFTEKKKRVLMVAGVFFALFLVVNTLSTIGMRWYMPFMMTMGLRILPNPEYVSYFEARGMPVYPELMARAGKPIQADGIAMYYDPDLEVFRQWARANGHGEFTRFLWFFKADTLQNPLRDADLVFNPDVYYYAATGYRPIVTSQRIAELLYPFRFGLIASFLANALALLLIVPAIRERNTLWIIPLALILLSYPQAVLVWNADANDIARHSVYHVVMLRLGFWMLILFVVDFFSTRIKPFIDRKKSNA